MTAENGQYLAVLEGLSCTGKSMLLERITESGNRSVATISKPVPHHMEHPVPEYFMKNDEAKFAAVHGVKERVAIMDRGWLSTLVFYTVMEEENPDFPKGLVRRWVDGNLGKTIWYPDYHIFIDIPPEVSRERAKLAGRSFAAHNMWTMHPERARDTYEAILHEQGMPPVIRLDGEQPPEVTGDQLFGFINSLTWSNTGQ